MGAKIKYLIDSLDLTQETRNEINFKIRKKNKK